VFSIRQIDRDLLEACLIRERFIARARNAEHGNALCKQPLCERFAQAARMTRDDGANGSSSVHVDMPDIQ